MKYNPGKAVSVIDPGVFKAYQMPKHHTVVYNTQRQDFKTGGSYYGSSCFDF